MWTVQRINGENAGGVLLESRDEDTWAQAWARAKQFAEDFEGMEGDTVVITSPQQERVCVATYTGERWVSFNG